MQRWRAVLVVDLDENAGPMDVSGILDGTLRDLHARNPSVTAELDELEPMDNES